MYRGTSVKSNTKEGEIKKLQKQLRRLENQYGQLLESCKPNPEVWTKLVEFIDRWGKEILIII